MPRAVLAEARIGAELKAAQERGEVARADGAVNQHRREGVQGADTQPATLPEIGIPRQRASEMKKLAEAGEGAIGVKRQRAFGFVALPPFARSASRRMASS